MEHALHLARHIIAAHAVVCIAHLLIRAQRPGDSFLPGLGEHDLLFPQACLHGSVLLKEIPLHGQPRIHLDVLRHVPDPEAGCPGNFARGRLLFAHEQSHERGLSRAVGTYEADLPPLEDLARDVAQDILRAVVPAYSDE